MQIETIPRNFWLAANIFVSILDEPTTSLVRFFGELKIIIFLGVHSDTTGMTICTQRYEKNIYVK